MMRRTPFSSSDLSPVLDDVRVFLQHRGVKSHEFPIYITAIFAFLSRQINENTHSLEEMTRVSEANFLDTLEGHEISPENARATFHLWQAYGQEVFPVTNSSEQLISRYQKALEHDERSQNTIKNYSADLRSFFQYMGDRSLSEFLTKPVVSAYLEQLKSSGLSDTSIERKTTALRQFFTWATGKGYAAQNPLELPEIHTGASTISQVDVSEPEIMNRGIQLSRVLRSEEHTSELQSPDHLVCRLLLEKKKNTQ